MSRGRFRRRPLLVLGLVGLPVLEVWLLIVVGHLIGVLPTVAILLGEAVVGGWLLRRQGTRSYRSVTGVLSTGRVPTRELSDAALGLLGGLLLVLPGFVTDLVALGCLLPLTRPPARRLLAREMSRRLGPPGRAPLAPFGATVIEGETVDVPAGASSTSGEIIRGEVEERRP